MNEKIITISTCVPQELLRDIEKVKEERGDLSRSATIRAVIISGIKQYEVGEV